MTDARVLRPDEWSLLSEMRLDALRDSPGSFLSNWKLEKGYREPDWRAEFSRGQWTVAQQQNTLVGLLGTTRAGDTRADGRYLEYLWVPPRFRRQGIASLLINEAVQRLRRDGVSTLWLWVLDGNEPARCFYRKHGFETAGTRQEVDHSTQLYEELMFRSI